MDLGDEKIGAEGGKNGVGRRFVGRSSSTKKGTVLRGQKLFGIFGSFSGQNFAVCNASSED